MAVNSEEFAVEVLEWDAKGRIRASVNGRLYQAVIKPSPVGELQVFLGGRLISLLPPRRAPQPRAMASALVPPRIETLSPGTVTSPIPGRVVLVRTRAGDKVKPGDALVVLESMKMESTVRAPRGGRIASMAVAVGQTVQRGQPLMTFA